MRADLATRRGELIRACDLLINAIACVQGGAHADVLVGMDDSIRRCRPTIVQHAGLLVANSPIKEYGLRATASIDPVIYHLANRIMILIKSVVDSDSEDPIDPEVVRGNEDLINAYVRAFFSEVDVDWLRSELQIEAANPPLVPCPFPRENDWNLREIEDWLAIREQVPHGWASMNKQAKSKWIEDAVETPPPPNSPPADLLVDLTPQGKRLLAHFWENRTCTRRDLHKFCREGSQDPSVDKAIQRLNTTLADHPTYSYIHIDLANDRYELRLDK